MQVYYKNHTDLFSFSEWVPDQWYRECKTRIYRSIECEVKLSYLTLSHAGAVFRSQTYRGAQPVCTVYTSTAESYRHCSCNAKFACVFILPSLIGNSRVNLALLLIYSIFSGKPHWHYILHSINASFINWFLICSTWVNQVSICEKITDNFSIAYVFG